jgi:MoaA/NifB/PqqE/SkfB family radical SAM enzyme
VSTVVRPVRLETLCVRLLRKCNLACRHCWAGSSPYETEALSWDEVCRFLRSLAVGGLKHVSLSGGEPFLYTRLGEAIGDCLDIGLCVTVTTNGFMAARYAALAAELGIPISERLRVRVSLDGTSAINDQLRGKGSYARALAAIRHIKRRQGWVGVNTVLVSSVHLSLDDLCAAVRDAQANDWALIAPLAKGSYEGATIDTSEVRTAMANATQAASRAGFTGRVRFWDFRVREQGHLVLEADGRLVMPGHIRETDCSLGDFRHVDLPELHEAVRHDASKGNCEFYTWRGWSITGRDAQDSDAG